MSDFLTAAVRERMFAPGFPFTDIDAAVGKSVALRMTWYCAEQKYERLAYAHCERGEVAVFKALWDLATEAIPGASRRRRLQAADWLARRLQAKKSVGRGVIGGGPDLYARGHALQLEAIAARKP